MFDHGQEPASRLRVRQRDQRQHEHEHQQQQQQQQQQQHQYPDQHQSQHQHQHQHQYQYQYQYQYQSQRRHDQKLHPSVDLSFGNLNRGLTDSEHRPNNPQSALQDSTSYRGQGQSQTSSPIQPCPSPQLQDQYPDAELYWGQHPQLKPQQRQHQHALTPRQTQVKPQTRNGGHMGLDPLDAHVPAEIQPSHDMDQVMLPQVGSKHNLEQRHKLPQIKVPPQDDSSSHEQEQKQRQRLRQGSLASDWRFPPTSPSVQSMRSPRSPRSPWGFQQYQSYSPSTPASPQSQPMPTVSQRHHPWQDWQAPLASSPAPRRPRDQQLRQNTDPLVYHRLISSDPVHTTRTLSDQTQDTQTVLSAQGQHNLLFSSSPTQIRHPPLVDSPSGIAAPDHHDQEESTEHDTIVRDIYPRQACAIVEPRYNRPNKPSETLRINDAHYDSQPLPVTPVSPNGTGPPRWDSLPHYSEPDVHPGTGAGLATTIGVVVTPTSDNFPSPLRSPRSPLFSSGQFPPPLIPEEGTLELERDPPDTRHEQAGPVTASGQVDRMYRPDSRQSGNTAYSATAADELNFSRPRKPSMRSLNRPDFSSMHLRPSTARSAASDSLRLEARTMTSSTSYAPFQPYNPSRPRRRPSDGSNISSSTFASATPSLRHQASEDRLGGINRNVSQNPAAGPFMGIPHTVHSQAPPRYYNRGGPPAQIQQSHLYEEGMRSSVRSHLTTSSAQETLFTEPERSSVMTKSSSVISSSFRNTRQSSFFGPHNPSLEVRDSLSVDDVMGMYENGFDDSDFDFARRMSGIEIEQPPEVPSLHLAPRPRSDDQDDSRPGSAMSHDSQAASRLLEAMSQAGPMPIPGRSFPLNGDGTKHLRDTNAFFRKSLASSLPKDMRLSFISTRSKMDGEETEEELEVDGLGTLETDSARHSRHDSGKMVGPRSEEHSPIEISEKQDEFILTTDIRNPPDEGRLSPKPPPMASPPTPSQPIQGAAQPEDLDPDANDRYGFRKSNQYVTREQYDEWNGQYSEYLARRRRKWEAFLKENGLMTDSPDRFPQHSAKAKRFVRKGIPPEWRGAAWFYYAGGPKILANNQGVYDNMVKRAASGQLKEVCREDIERDLYRTFPDNVRFRRKPVPVVQDPSNPTPAHSRNNSTQSANPTPKAPGSEPEIIDQLRRVLSAFAIFNPNIGYCQSLNFLGGMLLLFVETEEQAFWLLNIITRVYLPGTHEMNLEGSKIDLSVLMAELQEVLPTVWTKISDDGVTAVKKKSRRHRNKGGPNASDLPPVTLALTAWFMSCFIGTLPIETTLRVWDVFFYEGSKTLFRVALAIFKAGEPEIKAISDPMEVFAVVQSLPRKMLDANALMDICFRRRNGLNHLTSEIIDEQRAERKEQLSVERKMAMAAATGNPGLQPAVTISIGRKETDQLTVNSIEGVRRKHTLFSRNKGHKERERGMTGV